MLICLAEDAEDLAGLLRDDDIEQMKEGKETNQRRGEQTAWRFRIKGNWYRNKPKACKQLFNIRQERQQQQQQQQQQQVSAVCVCVCVCVCHICAFIAWFYVLQGSFKCQFDL